MLATGHSFADPNLLDRALTTPAYHAQHPEATDNQRLEFLGDAVLGLLAAKALYDQCPNEEEGPLTIRRTHMVSSVALCEAADRIGLVPHLKRNLHAAELPRHSKTIADAVEAVIGAAYLDGGFEAAKEVFDELDLVAHAEEGSWSVNPKGDLQERAARMVPPQQPVYELLKTEGTANEPVFTVRVSVEGIGSATGSDRTRKGAETRAAEKLLMEMY